MATVPFGGLVHRTVRYLSAVGMIAGAFALHFLLEHSVGKVPPFLVFYPAVMLAAIFAGQGPGIAATVMALFSVSFWLVPPMGKLSVASRADVVSTAFFGGMGLLMSVVAERSRQGQRRQTASAEAQLRMFAEYAPAALAMLDREMRYLRVSRRWITEGGLEDVQLIGRSHYEMYPNMPEAWKEEHRRALAGELIKREAEPCKGRDGKVFWLHRELRPWMDVDGAVGGIVIFSNDVTEQKRTQEQLERLTRTYALLSDINQTIVREKDRSAILAAACRIAVETAHFGMAWVGTVDPETGRLRVQTSSGDDARYLERAGIGSSEGPMLDCPATEAVRTGGRVVCNDIASDPAYDPWRERGWTTRFGSMAAVPLTLEGGTRGVFVLYAEEAGFFDAQEIALLEEMAADISYAMEVSQREEERLKAEAELRRRTTFFEALLESSPDAIIVIDAAGKAIFQNRRFNEFWKFPEGVWAGGLKERLEYVDLRLKDPEGFNQRIVEIYAEPTAVSEDEFELRDGTVLSRATSPVIDASGKYFGRIWLIRDITKHRQLERQLRQSQKMEAVGQLTGGIAHDFNNLLGIILGNLDLLEGMLEADAMAMRRLRTIRMASERGADVTRHLLSFSKSGELKPSLTRLDHSVENVVRLARTLGPDIQLSLQLDREIPAALVDASGLENALLNLIVNARDAMPGGGTVLISTHMSSVDETHPMVASGEMKAGLYACLQVTDEGHGMSSATLERVFEPFFTTKPQGRGTGLGLAMVYGFVKQSGGGVRIYSEEGHGTTVSVYLPLGEAEVVQGVAGAATMTPVKTGGRVLLVDDEAGLVELAEIYLRALGYRVLSAQTAAEALRIACEEDGLELLITDIIMPGGMNGVELAHRVRERFPEVRVIYSSGYPADAMADRGLPVIDGLFLRKPYQRSDFYKVVLAAMA